jgi:hypothetical protein
VRGWWPVVGHAPGWWKVPSRLGLVLLRGHEVGVGAGGDGDRGDGAEPGLYKQLCTEEVVGCRTSL